VDFCVTKGIPQEFANIQSCFYLSSYHSPNLVMLSSQALRRERPQSLCNRRTNFDEFRNLITERLTLHIPRKTAENIEATVQYFNDTIQCTCWNTTPEQSSPLKTNECPLLIKQKILDKCVLRRRWHQLRTSRNKRLLNTATRELKELLNNRNHNIQSFHQGLTPTDYSLWKAIKKNKTDHEINSPTTDDSRNIAAVLH
jgi:hypothetical protein